MQVPLLQLACLTNTNKSGRREIIPYRVLFLDDSRREATTRGCGSGERRDSGGRNAGERGCGGELHGRRQCLQSGCRSGRGIESGSRVCECSHRTIPLTAQIEWRLGGGTRTNAMQQVEDHAMVSDARLKRKKKEKNNRGTLLQSSRCEESR